MRRKQGVLLPLETAILSAGIRLRREGTGEFHGFTMAKQLAAHGDSRKLTSHGTLYKALDRLETAGLLESEWEDPERAAAEGRPRRRLYRVTSAGTVALAQAVAEQRSPAPANPAFGELVNRAADPFACRLARRWVLLYTARLAADARDARRAELDSDLWEHLSDAQANQQPLRSAQLAVLARMLFGVPSDLIWVRRVRRTMKEQRSMKQRRLHVVAVSCVAIALASLLVPNLLLDKSDAESADTIWWVLAIPIGFMLVGTIGLVATVLFVRERRRVRAAAH